MEDSASRYKVEGDKRPKTLCSVLQKQSGDVCTYLFRQSHDNNCVNTIKKERCSSATDKNNAFAK